MPLGHPSANFHPMPTRASELPDRWERHGENPASSAMLSATAPQGDVLVRANAAAANRMA